MIIVIGYLLVDQHERERALALSRPAVIAARSTKGCIDFAVSPDPVDANRINISERWASREVLEAFRDSGPDDDLGGLIQDAAVEEIEI